MALFNSRLRKTCSLFPIWVFVWTALLVVNASHAAGNDGINNKIQWVLGSKLMIPVIEGNGRFESSFGQMRIPFDQSSGDLMDSVSNGYAVYFRMQKPGWEISASFDHALLEDSHSFSLQDVNIFIFTIPQLDVDADMAIKVDSQEISFAYNLGMVPLAWAQNWLQNFYFRLGTQKLDIDLEVDPGELAGFAIPISIPTMGFSESWNVPYLGAEYRYYLGKRVRFNVVYDSGLGSDKLDRWIVGVQPLFSSSWEWELGYQATKYDLSFGAALSGLKFEGEVSGVYTSVSYTF